jgi:hypothetical protein
LSDFLGSAKSRDYIVFNNFGHHIDPGKGPGMKDIWWEKYTAVVMKDALYDLTHKIDGHYLTPRSNIFRTISVRHLGLAWGAIPLEHQYIYHSVGGLEADMDAT